MTNVSDLETFRREWQSELNKEHSEQKEQRIYQDSDVAVECYEQAVEAEQVGQLNDSLILYRKAFKLNDQVDKHYGHYIKQKQAREAEEIAIDSVTTVETVKNDIQINEDGKHTYNFSKTIQTGPDAPKQSTYRLDAIDKLIQSLNENLRLEADQEDEECPISTLPDEIILNIYRHLVHKSDLQTLMRFACSSRKLLVLSNDNIIWKDLVKTHLIPPYQIKQSIDVDNIATYKFNGAWRKLWLDIPRIRLDGVYISVCHYLRHGESGSAWNTFTQLVTFYRYLRFFNDGLVISWLSTDVPNQSVPTITKDMRSKGLLHGYWKLRGDLILISDLKDPDRVRVPYRFRMKAKLKSSVHGKHNKVDLMEYTSLNNEEEEVSIPLKHQRPFYFSKVRSWTALTPLSD